GHQRRVQDHRHPGNDLVAKKGREQKDVERDESVHYGISSTIFLVASCLISPACVRHVLAMSSSSQSSVSTPSFSESARKLSRLRAYISLEWMAPRLGRFSGPAMVTPLWTKVSPGRVNS